MDAARMTEDWLGRWMKGRTGWHEPDGNAALKKYWRELAPGSRVLVPLCGKARDLIWLESEGYDVTGVELSPVAVEEFFVENRLEFESSPRGPLIEYRALHQNIAVFCGDYFAFEPDSFDALFDRGSVVALPPALREEYAAHTRRRLSPQAFQLLITLEYDQSVVDGPPYSVLPVEVNRLWPGLNRISALEDIQNSPPKFRAAGLEQMLEVVWRSA